jgi:hypothetical protein
MKIINMDDIQESAFDNGFDPPTKLDSGRGNTNSFAGSGYMNRGGESVAMGQNAMFDIEEDNEDQFEQHMH